MIGLDCQFQWVRILDSKGSSRPLSLLSLVKLFFNHTFVKGTDLLLFRIKYFVDLGSLSRQNKNKNNVKTVKPSTFATGMSNSKAYD
jgi:hypothetical protein